MQPENTDSELTKQLFDRREYELLHLPYERELSFYQAVSQGNLPEVNRIMLPLDNSQLGHLSDDPIRNLQYHLVISIALITRFCIENGMDRELAYTLSDLYIQCTDKCTKENEIEALHQKLVIDFTTRMQPLHKERIPSKPIQLCLDYINDHLHENFSLITLSEHVHMNHTYMATLFKKETGLTIGNYIRHKKTEVAENMLKYSETPSVDISNYLAFSSHSHFIKTFKQETGLTPREYRNKFYRSKWR